MRATVAMTEALARHASLSPLVNYALKGLGNCWMPEHGLFSHSYHLGGAAPGNLSKADSDPFYSLNVLLGLSRLPRHGQASEFDVEGIFDTATRALLRPGVPKYAFGMALWTSAELGLELPADTHQRVTGLLADEPAYRQFTAQDLGMLLSGCVARARHGDDAFAAIAKRLRGVLEADFDGPPSRLFYNNAHGPRRRYTSFATCTYLTLALYQYGEWQGDERAIARANDGVAALIARQGPHGEWPWFFHAPSGRVLDMYEVYAVHQNGMAPAFLHHAVTHGVSGARDALERGFRWILGDNQLGRSMLVPELGLICRSQMRRGQGRARRAFRALANDLFSRNDQLQTDDQIEIRQECRSYQLGWLLWSFAGRDDYPALTGHPAFLPSERQ